MTKLLRKYNKWFLAIGGVLLMMTFLLTGPQSIFQPNPEKAVVANLTSGKVIARDMSLADKEYESLKNAFPFFIRYDLGVENGTHWLLLSKEAMDAGLVGADTDGLDGLSTIALSQASAEVVGELQQQYGALATQIIQHPQLGQAYRQQINQKASEFAKQLQNEAVRMSLAGRSHLTLAEFDTALSKVRGVMRLKQAYRGADRISDRRVALETQRMGDRVFINAVFVPADTLADAMPAPKPEELQALFDKYRTAKPNEGEYGFGYVLPNRVKLEWVEVEQLSMASAVKLDPVQVNKFYQNNRKDYPGDFGAERPKIEDRLRQERVDELMAEADRVIKAKIRAATRPLPTENGYKKLPADWEKQRPKLEDFAQGVVDAIQQTEQITVPLPKITIRAAEWVLSSDLRSLPGIGQSAATLGSKSVGFADLVGSTRDFNPKVSYGLQTSVPYETPTRDGAGNHYYFTILEARPEGPAESLDVVHATVERDARRLAAYEHLKADLSTYDALAATQGLDAVMKNFDRDPKPPVMPREIKLAYITDDAADRRFPELSPEVVRKAVMAVVRKLGMMKSWVDVPAPDRTVSLGVPEQLGILVAQLVGQSPVTEEEWRKLGRTVAEQFSQNELRSATGDGEADPFSFEAMKARLGYRPVREDKTSN